MDDHLGEPVVARRGMRITRYLIEYMEMETVTKCVQDSKCMFIFSVIQIFNYC